jgi:hypothetical protein
MKIRIVCAQQTTHFGRIAPTGGNLEHVGHPRKLVLD